jgi:hypothetical protein
MPVTTLLKGNVREFQVKSISQVDVLPDCFFASKEKEGIYMMNNGWYELRNGIRKGQRCSRFSAIHSALFSAIARIVTCGLTPSDVGVTLPSITNNPFTSWA